MFQFRRFPAYTYFIQCTLTEYCSAGFPHSDISGSLRMCRSPKLFAACRVLHRLLVPRHSPYALYSLIHLWSFKWFSPWLRASSRTCHSFFKMLHLFAHLLMLSHLKSHPKIIGLFSKIVCLPNFSFYPNILFSFSLHYMVFKVQCRLAFAFAWKLFAFFFRVSPKRVLLVEIMRFELMTPCLQGRCSPSWAIPPSFAGHSCFATGP